MLKLLKPVRFNFIKKSHRHRRQVTNENAPQADTFDRSKQ